MKRFTLALIALLSVVVVFADGPKKQLTKLPTMPAKASIPLRQKLDIKEAPASLTMKKAPAQATPRRGPRKAPSAADLEGVYTWDYLQAERLSTDIESIGTTSYSDKVTITQSETTEGGLTISGMATNTLEATIDGDYIVIESGQPAGVSDYGAYTVVGGFYYEGDEEHEAGWYSWDIHGKIQDDGSICFEEWIISLLTNGEYAGHPLFCYVSGSTLTPDESLSLVKVPEGVEIVPYVMFYYDPLLEVDATIPVNVAVDGNDVYFQGLGAGAKLPKAWVKGTKSGNIVTFPEKQYMGQGPLGSTYGFSYGGDVVFTYAPVTDIYTAEGYVGVTTGGSTETFYNPVLKRVIERAAMPANPAILSLDRDYYNRLNFNVFLKDTDGAPLDASKLSYMIYTDTDGNISPLTFTPTTHYALTEDLTEIPYGFTDNYDFTKNHIYLNDLYSSDWDRIGIQSIYTCGGERNATPIQWFENKEAYAVVKGNTLTFYYDSERATREGLKYNLPNYYGDTPGWTGYNNGNGNTTITTATFDESFKNNTRLKNTGCWFYYMKALTTINHFDYLNTANVRDMSSMFEGCTSLANLDVTNLNTANVRDMSSMFCGCSGLTTIDLSNFDMTNVTDTRSMFQDCTNLTTIYCNADWSLGVVSESEGMFDNCPSLKGAVPFSSDNDNDISFANPTNGYFTGVEAYAVVDKDLQSLTFYYDFNKSEHESDANKDVFGVVNNDWDEYPDHIFSVTIDESMENYHGLTTTSKMFKGLYEVRGEIKGLRYLNTEHVTDMSNMFEGCQNLDSLDLSHFNTSQVTDMDYMFYGCSALEELDLSSFNTSKVTRMIAMFSYCMALESVDLSSFNTSRMGEMGGMFNKCKSLKSLDLTNFNMSNVSDVEAMFYGCSALTTIYCNDDWSKYPLIYNDAELFSGCVKLVGAVPFEDGNDYSDWANPDTGYFTRKLVRGDVNGDSKVTIADVTALVNIILGKTTSYNTAVADINNDTKITIADVTALVNIILGK